MKRYCLAVICLFLLVCSASAQNNDKNKYLTNGYINGYLWANKWYIDYGDDSDDNPFNIHNAPKRGTYILAFFEMNGTPLFADPTIQAKKSEELVLTLCKTIDSVYAEKDYYKIIPVFEVITLILTNKDEKELIKRAELLFDKYRNLQGK
jgi:hypothetical protein